MRKKLYGSKTRHINRVGEQYGSWTISRPIGKGGNGHVYLATNASGNVAAIKILSKVKKTAYQRFRDEVEALKVAAGTPGILPILQSFLPESIEDGTPWYVMPVGESIEEWAKRVTATDKVAAIGEIAFTLAELHELRIAHRDIKPPNLVMYQRRCYIVDFGLVTYPGKPRVTAPGERIGPFNTMAPEVRLKGAEADPFPGDVYALSKSLWSTLRGEDMAFNGQYSASSSLNISGLFPDEHITPLEQLLTAATDRKPNRRPTMKEFAEKLAAWLANCGSFGVTNPLLWAEALERLFPRAQPAIAEWKDPAQIVAVLNSIGAANLNHLFYPSGGGNDLTSARLSTHEPGCVEFKASNWSLVKPARLIFHGFPDTPEWSYLRLEADTLESTGIYPPYDGSELMHEELTRVGPSTYAERECWDNNLYHGKALYKGAHTISRWFGGSFVIFQKSSFYNLVRGTRGVLDAYRGRHNQMGDADFFTYVSEMRRIAIEKGIDLRKARYEK